MLRHLTLAAALCLSFVSTANAQCVWGSFDSSRINYAAGTFTGTGHTTLRGIVTTNGGTIGAATSTLTAAYLAKVRVFYTSLLKTSGGALSIAEQTALRNWVNGGGVLIMTADYINLAACNSVTNWLGVTYTATKWTGTGVPTSVVHLVTLGITKVWGQASASFNVPTAAKLLVHDNTTGKRPFIMVFDPTSTQKGCVLVVGDHNNFTNSYIAREQNRALATNIARWACGKGGGCSTKAARLSYCTGLAGKNGIPLLTASANPVNGSSITILGTNSSGSAMNALLAVGLTEIRVPFLGGTLCTTVDLPLNTIIPAPGLRLTATVPPASVLCGTPIYMQLFQLDSAARAGVSMSRGLKLTPGS